MRGEKLQAVGLGMDRLYPLHDVLEVAACTPMSEDTLIKWMLFQRRGSSS